jgi:cysteine-rich repeat protein
VRITTNLCVLLMAAACDGGTPHDAGRGMPDSGSLPDACVGAGCSAGECGDGVVDPGEGCDDANDTAFDGCENDCEPTCTADAQCGNEEACDGIETCAPCADETCALGRSCTNGTALGDGADCPIDGESGVCRSGECVIAGCGNAVVEDDESCDDGNEIAGDGCEGDCRFTCEVDPSMPNTWYADCDGDGFATIGAPTSAECLRPAPSACGGGWTLRVPVAGAADCDDTDPAILPGATEVCDGEDTDCDGTIDDGVTTTFFLDADGDDHGNASSTTQACALPDGYAAIGDDCNDACAACFPGNTEICDGADNDCDSMVDDGENGCGGVCPIEDAPGEPCDGPDADLCADDTFVCTGIDTTACNMPGDADAETCNNLDDDCDGTVDEGSVNPCGGVCVVMTGACEGPDTDNCADDTYQCTGRNATVCSTGDNDVETCNGVDDDCDGTIDDGVTTRYYRDADMDTYGNPSMFIDACTPQPGYVSNASDCYDNNINARPGQTAYFPGHRGDGSFDYNCVGGQTLRHTWATTCPTASCTVLLGGACVNLAAGGYCGGTSAPPCGTPTQTRVCTGTGTCSSGLMTVTAECH